MTFIDENDEVLIAGFGRSGHAVGDLPGVRFQVVKVAGVSMYALWLKKKEKPIKWDRKVTLCLCDFHNNYCNLGVMI